MLETQDTERTCLFEKHKEAGAKFTPFGGWEMPVLYSGVIDEHQAVRTNAGLFDVSHMGEVTVKGPDALAFLQYVTSNDVTKLVPGRAQYSLLLNDRGGVVDDIIVYLLGSSEYLLCVNAANTDKDFAWLNAHSGGFEVELVNESPRYGQLALQGPRTRQILASVFGKDAQSFSAEALPPFSFRQEKLRLDGSDTSVLVACTGYTGEDGVEIFCPTEAAPALWELLLEKGRAAGLKPAGLGARDTLRLEVCYPLHGHELGDELPALSCGVGWVIKFDKGDFIGKAPLAELKRKGLPYTLIGFEVVDRGIVRADAKLHSGGRQVGWVASGTHAPTVGKAVGLGFVPPDLAKEGTSLEADVRGKLLKVTVVKRPFYQRK